MDPLCWDHRGLCDRKLVLWFDPRYWLVLLDMNPDHRMAKSLRQTIEDEGDTLTDLHLWRLGPGHLGAIVSIGTHRERRSDYYRAKLARFRSLSHLTVEVRSS